MNSKLMIKGLSIFVLFLFFACAKEPGEGGLSEIQGYVYIQNLDPNMQPVGKAYPAFDEDVFIHYGNQTNLGDDEPTSCEGFFSFPYLMPGDYKLYVYSQDTSYFHRKNKKNKIAITQNVTLSKKKETFVTDTFFIYQHLNYNDGVATIIGNVQELYYFAPNLPKQPVAGQNVQVFIMYQNGTGTLDRVRTAFDGSFIIQNLIPGDYYVYALSEQDGKDENVAVGKNVTITDTTFLVTLDTLYVSNY